MDLIVNRIVQLSALRVYVTMLTDPVLAKMDKMDIFTAMKVSDTLCGSIIILSYLFDQCNHEAKKCMYKKQIYKLI